MVQTTIILDDETKNKMTRYCKKFGYSQSGLISFLLNEKMEEFE